MNLNWPHIQNEMQDLLADTSPARHWLKAIKFSCVRMIDSRVVVQLKAENKLTLQMCERYFLKQLKLVIENRLLSPVEFDFQIESTQVPFEIFDTTTSDENLSEFIEAPAVQTVPTAPVVRFQFKSKYQLNTQYTFEQFCVTTENALAKKSVEYFVQEPQSGIHLMTLTGPSGTGKTHLLNAAGWLLLQAKPHLKVKLITGDDLLSDFQSAIFKKSMTDFRMKYRLETDVLLIDDIHCLNKAKATQAELFNIINEFQMMGKKIIITCDRSFTELDTLDERLKSRLLGSLNVSLEHPSLTSKMQILKYKLEAAEVVIPNIMVQQVLLGIGPCIRSVEGAVHRLKMLIKTSGTITQETLNKMFPLPSARAMDSVGTDSLLTNICTKHGITLNDLKGPSRQRALVQARKEAAFRLKTELNKNVTDISKLLHRDHSTIFNLLKTKSSL